MRHLIIFITFVTTLIVTSCSQKKTYEAPLEDTTQNTVMDSSFHYDCIDDSVNVDNPKRLTKGKPIEDNRSFYERGYDEGYDNGREDGTMDLGDGYSYCDANPYNGAAKREYERGYKRGYRKGYNEGFYEYSDGDEEDYDEY